VRRASVLVAALLVCLTLPAAASAAYAGALLRALPAAPETTAPTYSRAAFHHWITTQDCTARQHVLFRQDAKRNADGCKARYGYWRSVYDGLVFTNSSLLDVDHMVPLAEAWRSGAGRSWDASTRERYANDLAFRPTLIAVSAASNRSKGDKDPSEWAPPLASYGCRYAVNWIAVKYRWHLAVDPAERAALATQLKGCPRSVIVLAAPPRATITNSKPAPPAAPAPTPATGGGGGGSGYPQQVDQAGDQDCADFDGPVQVLPGDPDDLDRDGDGVGCE
jgi:hypothetical protein